MRILHISDTHGKHHLLTNLPKADVIVHSGDACSDTFMQAYGIEKSNDTIFINASIINESNEIVNKPFIFDI